MEYLLRTERAASVRAIVREPEVDLHVPALCDIEVAAALRRAMLTGGVNPNRASQAVRDLVDLPLTRHDHRALLPRVLELRSNFSAYDAAYVALAERLEGQLLTADKRLMGAVRRHTSLVAATE